MKLATSPWNEIAARMGNEVTEAEASRMIKLLNDRGIQDTDELSDAAWFELVAEAAQISSVP